MVRPIPGACQELISHQLGILARWQAIGAGLNVRVIDTQLQRGRWQALYRGVYATFTGQPSRQAVMWAAVLRAGPESALGYHSAAELDALADRPSDPIHVVVSSSRRVSVAPEEYRDEMPPIAIHYRTGLQEAIHPVRRPPRTRIEETTIDLTQMAPSLEEAMSWLARACSKRLTTSSRLHVAMAARPKMRWRAELSDALRDVASGIHSALEWRYVRKVEAPHGLPAGKRQARSRIGDRTRYLDNHYREFGVVVELDGRVAHPAEARWRDIHRDNASAAAGMLTLRYNWADIADHPCRVAAEIAAVLRSRGWTAPIRACSPTCTAPFS
jgi:very-short-patch-repair endonuclease